MPHKARENLAEISCLVQVQWGKFRKRCVENRAKNWPKARATRILSTL